MNVAEATRVRIKELCKAKGISEYRLIQLSELAPSTIKSIMSGKSGNPGIVGIHKICDALGISIRDFYGVDLFDNLDGE